ncbi:Arc family DNA-binding protein [Pseudomonas luteola]|uniref:Arc family DNA-binding protein n=1 Tax=Pseudomonas luteola TaxID=47886 RepID=A0ABS0MUZ2_PSELU|nr:Arc family DNA-binding protein [Pseudomonas luteola]MBH3440543.1 Arc family DNA-binding protein [Pseudomonas luteola]
MEDVMRTQVRLPKDLGDWLKTVAQEQSRSMNGQLIEYLKMIRGNQSNGQK